MCIISIVNDPFLSLVYFSCGYTLLVIYIWAYIYSHFLLSVLFVQIFLSQFIIYVSVLLTLFFVLNIVLFLIIVYGQTCWFFFYVSGSLSRFECFSTRRLWKFPPTFLSSILCFKLLHLNVQYIGSLFSCNEWVK